MSMSKRLVAGILASLAAGVVVFALFYTPEGRWTRGTIGGPPIAASPLEVALSGCLKAHGPGGLAAFSRNRVNRMSGWFIPTRRRADVARCMAGQGWLYMPHHLYSP